MTSDPLRAGGTSASAIAGEGLVFEEEAFGPELAQQAGGFGGLGIEGVDGIAHLAGVGGIGAAPGIDEEAVGAADLQHVARVVAALAHGDDGEHVGPFPPVEEIQHGG